MSDRPADKELEQPVVKTEVVTEPVEDVKDLGDALAVTRNGRATATENNRGYGK